VAASPATDAARSRGAGTWSAVALAGVTAVLVFALFLVASSWIRSRRHAAEPGTGLVSHASEVVVWVGDLAPGVNAVLSSQWDDPAADAVSDDDLNRALGIPADRALSYYRLTVSNTTDRPVTLDLRDGSLVVTPAGGTPLPAKSLATLLAGSPGHPAPSSAQAGTLRLLGAARESVEVAPGARYRPWFALERRVRLGDAISVARADGVGFEPRRIPVRRWEEFLGSPTKDRIDDLARDPR
jgi:hypothetical protein